MAKIFFENRFLLTKKLHKQYSKETFKKMRKSTSFLSLGLAFLTLIAAILAFIFFAARKILILFLLAFIYFILMSLFGYIFSDWLNFRNMKRNYGEKKGGEVVYQIKFEPTEVRVKVGSTGYTFKYTTIEKIYETEDLLIFILNAKGMIEHGQIIYKKGFTDKSPETLDNFRKFINDKMNK